jgi:S-methylmethionine-dependent homocysteine/selenocysteine methylase
VAAELGVETLLFNCSQPEVIGAAIDAARDAFERWACNIQIGAYANAFHHATERGAATTAGPVARFRSAGYLHWAADWQQAGEPFGRVLRDRAEHIAVLAQKLA